MNLRQTALVAGLLFAALVATEPAIAQRDGATGVRGVDFYNFEYPLAYAGENSSVRVRDGKFVRDSEDDRLYVEVRKVVYGDLTGDGNEEAVVLTLTNTGGTGQFTDGLVYAIRGETPVLLASLGAGDRADGGIHDVSIRDGRLVVERYGHFEAGGACCPQFVETESLRLSADKLVTFGEPARRAYASYAAEDGAPQRVQFVKGSSSATLAGSTLGNERYLVGARAGQVISLDLRSGDATAVATLSSRGGAAVGAAKPGSPWSGSLPANGDYVIAIQSKAPPDSDSTYYTVELSIR